MFELKVSGVLNQKKPLIQIEKKRIVKRRLRDMIVIEIESSLEAGVTVGDKVRINGEVPIDGEYVFGWFDSLIIKDGKIARL